MIAPLRPSIKWLSAVANLAITVLSLSIAPYILLAGSFWGAPVWELVSQIVITCAVPLVSIPISLAKADRFQRLGKLREASHMRFLPVLMFLVIGPAGFVVISLTRRLLPS